MFDNLATSDDIKKIIEALKVNNIEAELVGSGKEALERIMSLIPKGVSVMNGSSKTLEEIGFIEYLKSGNHSWNNLHEAIVKETDPQKQANLRKQALLADYYLGSVHALTMDGKMLFASNTGSQMPHLVFSSSHLILVVGAQKIVANMNEAMLRLEEYVIPLEDKRMMGLYNVHTFPSKVLMFNRENPKSGRKVMVLIINEKLGF